MIARPVPGDRDAVAVTVLSSAGILAAVIAVYVGVVVVPHVVLDRDGAIGSGFVLPLTATALVAVLLEPTRRATRKLASRVVRGGRAEPYDVLSGLAARLAPGRDDDQISTPAAVLAEGLGAEEATIWVRPLDAARLDPLDPLDQWPPGRTPRPTSLAELQADPDQLVHPIVHLDELLGAVSVARSRTSIGLSDHRLLAHAASSLALPLRNRRLVVTLHQRAAEVAASRRRLIEVHDTERRRLERDLHDGAQQHLVALGVKLGVAATMAERAGDPSLAATIGEAVEVANDGVASMREVAHGIYPPRLEAKGLASAVRGIRRPDGAAVTIEVQTDRRFPRSIEETAYFCVVELTSRAVEAGVTEIDLLLGDGRDGGLEIDVDHDGDPERLSSMAIADRVAAAGGVASVEAAGDRRRLRICLPGDDAEARS